MDDETAALLVDVMHALMLYPHHLPPEIVGRIAMAIGPRILNAPMAPPTHPYPPAAPDPTTRITTWEGTWERSNI